MKTTTLLLTLAAALGLVLTASAVPSGKPNIAPVQLTLPEGCDTELVRDAAGKVVKTLLSEFVSQKDIVAKRFAVAPLAVDFDGTYVTDQTSDQFTTLGKASGFELFTRADDEWKRLLEEFAKTQREGDIMDPVTVQKFGRIQGVQGIITGKLVSVTKDGDDTKVRVSLRAFEVETGRQLWGKEATEIAHKTTSAMEQITRLGDSPNAKLYGWLALAVIVGLFVIFRVVKAFGAAARPR